MLPVWGDLRTDLKRSNHGVKGSYNSSKKNDPPVMILKSVGGLNCMYSLKMTQLKFSTMATLRKERKADM